MKISWIRVIFLVAILCISGAASYYAADALRNSEKPSEYIAVIFSILAASVFAVVGIIGDPSMLLPGSARTGWESAKAIQLDLQRFNHLFFWYIATLGLLVVCELVKSEKLEDWYWLYRVYAFFATFGFLASLSLPYEFSRVQQQRLEDEIAARPSRGP